MAAEPSAEGYHHVSLSVRDLDRSIDWYCDVLRFEKPKPFDVDRWKLRRARLAHPNGMILALTCHKHHSNEPFDERRPGIDHIGLLATSEEEVRACADRCRERGDYASEVEKHSDEGGAKVTLRDPDNIQIEVVFPA